MKIAFIMIALLLAGCDKEESTNPAEPNRYSIPNKPSLVRIVRDIDTHNVVLYWRDNSDNEDGFKAGHTQYSYTYWTLPENATSSEGYDLSGNGGETYTYYVRGFNRGGDGPRADTTITWPR